MLISNNSHKLNLCEGSKVCEKDSKHLNNFVRPASALLRGVKITEFNESKINPEPVTVEDIDFFVGDALSPSRLRDLTGCDDLKQVETLELKVNTCEKSLGNFGEHLLNLSMLKLSHSCVPVVRDLGSCLKNLRVLHMCRCGVSDLDGLPMLVSLRELYMAYNDITDISSCGLLEYLTILDLEGNNISDISQMSFLNLCSKLTSLTLEGNPVCIKPYPDSTDINYNYRESVFKEIAQLKVLDGESFFIKNTCFKDEAKKTSSLNCKQKVEIQSVASEGKVSLLDFQEDWNMLYDLMEDDCVTTKNNASTVNIGSNMIGRPMTQQSLTPRSSIHRPGSSLKDGKFIFKESNNSPVKPVHDMRSLHDSFDDSTNVDVSTARQTPTIDVLSTSKYPKTCASIESGIFSASSLDIPTMDESSPIVFCGNLARAMRFRKQPASLKKLLKHEVNSLETCEPIKPERSILVDEEEPSTLDDDLKDMRKEIQRSIAQIKAKKSPQVLKINHEKNADSDCSDDAIHTSDDDDDEITSHRKDKHHQTYVNERDRKRESLDSFADYFIELASDPINLKSEQFSQDCDLEKYDDTETSPSESQAHAKSKMGKIKRSSLKDETNKGMEWKGRYHHTFKDASEIPTSISSSIHSIKKKREGVRLNPLHRIHAKQDHDFSINSSDHPLANATIPISLCNRDRLQTNSDPTVHRKSNNSYEPPIHENTVMRAASQFLRTGRVSNCNY